MSKPKGLSAYLLFSADNRAQAKEELRAQAGEGAKISVAEVAKVLGQRWKALSDEERSAYTQRAAAGAAEKAAAQEQQAGADGQQAGSDAADQQQQTAGEQQPAHQQPASLPLSLVRKIAMCDADVARVTKDSVQTLAMCAEMFIGLLAVRAKEAAMRDKRKTVRLEDFQHIVKHDKRLVDMGLKDIANDKDMFAKRRKEPLAETEEQDENQDDNPAQKKLRGGKAAKDPPCATKDIATFFQGS